MTDRQYLTCISSQCNPITRPLHKLQLTAMRTFSFTFESNRKPLLRAGATDLIVDFFQILARRVGSLGTSWSARVR